MGKVVEKERVGEKLPKGWRKVRLGDVCKIVMGQSPEGTSYNSEKIGEPLLNGPTEFGKVYPIPSQWTTDPKRFAESGDILFCVRGATTGRKNIADQRYCIGRGLAAIRGDENQTITEFLFYLLDFVTSTLLQETSGSTFPNLSGEKLEGFKVVLPPLPEQKRIVGILSDRLSAIEQARAATDAQLAAAKALPAAYLRQVFDSPEAQKWKRKKLRDVLELRREVIHPRNKPEGPATFVGLEHIQSLTGIRIGSLAVEMSELTGRKPQFYEGDIVYGYLRPYLNKVWLAEFDGLCSVDQYVFSTIRTVANPNFVAWFMRSPVYLNRAPIGDIQSQLPRIRTDEVMSVDLNLPSLEKQQQIVKEIAEKLSETERLRQSLQSQLDTINQLPAALLRQAFNGEL